MSEWIIAAFLLFAAIIFVLQYALTKYAVRIEHDCLIIRSSFAGIPGWVYRCPLSNIESYKWPAMIFDMGSLGGHVWGPPWASDGLVLRLRKSWWLFRRAFLWTKNAREIAAELEQSRIPSA